MSLVSYYIVYSENYCSDYHYLLRLIVIINSQRACARGL